MNIVSAGNCDCICLNCKWEGKLKDCDLRMNGVFICPKCKHNKIAIKKSKLLA